jgi:hypothetical protein
VELPPLQIVLGAALAVTVKALPTVTVTEAVELQPPFATVTVYVVVTVGLATGLAIVVLLNPVAGLHE